MAKARLRDVKQGKNKEKRIVKKDTKYQTNILYASISDKIKAFITDLFMLLMPFMYLAVYFIIGSREEFETNMIIGWLYILIPNFIIVVTFFFKKGQTPGCKAYEIKLVNRDNDNIPSLFAIILRYYIELLSFITVVGIFLPFFRKDKKSLQDLISATQLIKIDR